MEKVDPSAAVADPVVPAAKKSKMKKSVAVYKHAVFARLSEELGIGKSLGRSRGMVVLNPGTNDEIQVWGYRRSAVKLVLTLAAVLLSGGTLGLFLYWVEHYWLYCTHNQCSLGDATSVLVVVSTY